MLKKTKPNEAVLFGNSPFINSVDVPGLNQHYRTVGMNSFGQTHIVDDLFFFDFFFPFLPHTGRVHVPTFMDTTSYKKGNVLISRYSPTNSLKPVFQAKAHGTRYQSLGFCNFLSSAAMNHIINQKHITKVYLIGVDHKEDDTKLSHFDDGFNGVVHFDCNNGLCAVQHQQLKQFIYNCKPHIDIFQCNPDVVDEWNLPYKDVNELYEP